MQVRTFRERSGCRNKGTWKTNPCHEEKEIKTKRNNNEQAPAMKRCIFHLPFPKLSKQILDKDHFAMQTRLNLWMQLFVKTKNFSFKLRSLLSINQYNKRIPYKEECGVYGLRG